MNRRLDPRDRLARLTAEQAHVRDELAGLCRRMLNVQRELTEATRLLTRTLQRADVLSKNIVRVKDQRLRSNG